MRLLIAFIGTALAAAAIAQIDGGDRGVAPVASTGVYEVSGVAVDIAAKTADEARYGGWRLAQRKAWGQLAKRLGGDGAGVGDAMLDQLVAGIVVENEQIGPTRYIARLGVLFNRARAAAQLGVTDYAAQSAPMLVLPIEVTGGVARTFEQRTDWQAAWARFRSGDSSIDYIRPAGTGPDPLLLDHGQAGRRGRGWWRTLLDQYGASDVVMPTVQLVRQYPGGPVVGHFSALHGPDGDVIARFDLSAPDSDHLARMLDEGVRRIDEAYGQALRDGQLRTDSSLIAVPVAVPVLPEEPTVEADSAIALAGAPSTFLVQVDTPDDPALVQVQASLRGLPGVKAVATDSVALGGVSVLRVAYDGDPQVFRTALASAGYNVQDTGGGLRLTRPK